MMEEEKTFSDRLNKGKQRGQKEEADTPPTPRATVRSTNANGSAVTTLALPLWSLILTVFSGISNVKRMVRKEDWTKIMFVYLCLFHVAPGQLCGPSPLAGLERMAQVLGKDLNQLLNTLRTQNFPAYQRLEDHWRHYMDCIAMVDTGYFK